MFFDFFRKQKKDIGLVLCGGGALGAYQMGAWRAIREAGLEKRITGVSGTSIGACNTAIFLNGDLEKGEQIWKDVVQKDLTYPNKDAIQESLKEKLDEITLESMKSRFNRIKAELTEEIKTMMDKEKREEKARAKAEAEANEIEEDATFMDYVGRTVSWFYENIDMPVFSQEGIEKIIDEKVPLEGKGFRNKDIYSTVTALGKKIEPIYVSWKDKTPQERKNLILTSAAIPVAFNDREINGIPCVDGGLVDNRPIKPLYDIGYRKFIVVNLDNEKNFLLKKDMKYIEKNYTDCKFIHITPSKEFNDSPMARMKINHDLTMRRMVMGYLDAKEAIGQVLGGENGNRF